MKILLATHRFHPDTGGIESMSMLLAQRWAARGHQVLVVTQSPDSGNERYPFEVLRRPSRRQLIDKVRWCDVFFQNNISLQSAWPLLWIRRPWVVTYQTWIGQSDGSLMWRDCLKLFLTRFSVAISISEAIAAHLPRASTIIGNSYSAEIFNEIPGVVRERELVFLGRLVSDKGLDLLLTALALLQRDDLHPRLTVIGEGPEMPAMKKRVIELGLQRQVEFIGQQAGRALSALLNQHQIMVVPSLWKEPFGIVALEGAACGCVVVGSEQGGLKDAIGPAGVVFANGDAAALAGVLKDLLLSPERMAACRRAAPEHLARYAPEEVVGAYLQVFEKALARRSRLRTE